MIKIKQILSIVFALSFYSCSENNLNLSLPEKDFTKLLLEIHLAEGMVTSEDPEKKDSLLSRYYRSIFSKHKTDSSTFFNDLKILETKPKELKRITDSTYKMLERLENGKINLN
jgi:hypothetical protein